MKKHKLLACGGTFDLLHEGHKKFIRDSLKYSENVVIGITTDEYISNFKKFEIESFRKRKSELKKYLHLIKATERVKIIGINTPFEPLLDKNFKPDVLMVTSQTKKGALEINKKRKEFGLPILDILEVEMKKADDGDFISSTRIRNGEINRKGMLYIEKNWKNRVLILPKKNRFELHKPFGKIIKNIPENLDSRKIITIGDVTSLKFNKLKINQFISVIDFKIQRNLEYSKVEELNFSKDIKVYKVINKPSTINSDLFNVIRKSFKSDESKIILVSGEEDLVFLPIILISPLKFKIFYGQPNKGLVEVVVNEENKEKAFRILKKFKVE